MSTLALCAALSGCAALIYQTLWIRVITEVLGHTVWAVAAVTAAFMAGLACGSWAADGLARRFAGRLTGLYSFCELGLGLLGWFSRDLLRAAQQAGDLWWGAGASSGAAALTWFPLFFLVLGPATFLLGLTLPLLVSWAVARQPAEKAFGYFYGFNTVGAAAGCLLGALILPSALGVAGGLRAAAALNVAAAGLAWLTRSAPASAPPAPTPVRPAQLAWVDGLAFLCGAGAMAAESVWIRMLQQLLGSSAQTVGLALFYILLGIGVGGLLYRALSQTRALGAAGWAWVQIALAAALLCGLLFFERFFYFGALILAKPEIPFAARLSARALFCAALVFPGSLLMGLSLPWLFGCRKERENAAGRFYAANALGCVAGAFTGAFVFLPSWGMERSLSAVVFSQLALGAWAARAASPGRKAPAAAACMLLGIVAVARPAWDHHVISSGVALYWERHKNVAGFEDFKRRAGSSKLLYYADGLSATVGVTRGPSGDRSIRVNGKTEASSELDVMSQLLAGYIPLFLHPTARRALVVGLGSGTSAGALAQSQELRSLEIVEIEPRVRDAAGFFEKENRGVLRDPRVALVFGDARHYLAAARGRYDLIASEPSNPWVSGVASLYTREHFINARERLAPDGVFCQWYHSYGMSPADFKMILATFFDVFPRVMLFRGGITADYFLVGARRWPDDRPRLKTLVKSSPAIKEDLARFRFDGPLALLGGAYALEDEAWRRYAAGSPLNTDDKPRLEFSAMRGLYENKDAQIYDALESLRAREYPALFDAAPEVRAPSYLARVGAAAMGLRDFTRAERLLKRALESPGDPQGAVDYALIVNRLGRPAECEKILLAAASRHPTFAESYFFLGDFYAQAGDYRKALAWHRRGAKVDPHNQRANLSLGSLYLALGEAGAARAAFRRGLERGGDPEIREMLERGLRAVELKGR